MDRKLMEKFQDLIYTRFGIHYTQGKRFMLEAKLDKLQNHVGDMEQLYQQVSQGNKTAVDSLMRTVTVNHTFFFREESHFQILAEDIRKKKLEAPLIWCAASSTGEEPYTIAITLLEKGVEDFRILASDISPRVLQEMHRGIYSKSRFSNTPPGVVLKYFTKAGGDAYKIRPALRRYLIIKKLNLHDHLEFQEDFDYVFCRNVMIYFDDQGRRKVVENVTRNLKTGGLFFVGHTEALLNVPLGLVKEGQSLFRKVR